MMITEATTMVDEAIMVQELAEGLTYGTNSDFNRSRTNLLGAITDRTLKTEQQSNQQIQ